MKQKSKSLRAEMGFTLVEVLVAIAIIGILATVIMAALGKAREKAKDAATMAQMSQMRTQATQYYIANRTYGSTMGAVSTWDSCKMPNTVFVDPAMAALVAATFKTSYTIQGSLAPSVVCGSNGTDWIVYGLLYKKRSNGAIARFCVDSRGNAMEGTKSFILNERDAYFYNCEVTR